MIWPYAQYVLQLLTKTCFCALNFAIHSICCLFHVVEHKRGIQHKLSSRLLGESFPVVITQISFSIQHLNSICLVHINYASLSRSLFTYDAHKNTQRCSHSLAFKFQILPWAKEHFSWDLHLRFKAGDHTTVQGGNVSLIAFIWQPCDMTAVKLHHVTHNCYQSVSYS